VATDFVTPNTFLQNVDFLAGRTTLSFDFRVFEPGILSADQSDQRLAVLFSGPGGSARWIAAPTPTDPIGVGWVTMSTVVDEQFWILNSGTWAGLLEDVTSLRIRTDSFSLEW
jgi:hypothetical protein